jgi:Zn-dependent M28 family amino/carboxypeptidase
MSAAAPLTPEEQTVHDGLKQHITMLSEVIGERSTFRPGGLEATARYIEDQLRKFGYTTRPRPFPVEGQEVRNIEVEVPGLRRPDQIVILGAHYDSVDCPAANDNASGVAGVLEAARLLSSRRFKRTLRFVLFVNEEPPHYKGPHMGSFVYARECRERNENIVAMVNLETIGYYSDDPGSQRYPLFFNRRWFRFLPRRGNFVAFVGNFPSWRLAWRMHRQFRRFTKFPAWWLPAPDTMEGPGMSDHWCFWQQGFPAIMVTDTAFFRYHHYHLPTDTVDKIVFPPTARVVTAVAKALAALAGG